MLKGFRAALGAPAVAMAATFLGFGAAVSAAGLGLGWAMASALAIYGMPGQLILLTAAAGGGALGAAVLSAIAANARFLPMAVALSPWLGGRRSRWLALPFIAVTPWAAGMRTLPGLPPARRLGWFLGFAAGCWGVATAATLLGFWMAPGLPGWLLALLSSPTHYTSGCCCWPTGGCRQHGARCWAARWPARWCWCCPPPGGCWRRGCWAAALPSGGASVLAAADWALLAVAVACQGLRALGLLLAGPLRPDHPFIRWAASVAQATLAAFVVLAVAAPSGALAAIPLAARLAGAGAAIAVLAATDRILAALLAGLAATLAAWALLI